jgi:MFS family permease
MADSRSDRARERDLRNPAHSAGFFVARLPSSLRDRAAATGARMGRPSVDPVAQSGYEKERIYEVGIHIGIAVMEGGFVGVIADKMYAVHPAVLALISAASMFGNLSSFLWARLAQGRPKVPFLHKMQLLFLAFVFAIALLPEGPWGAAGLVLSVIAARLVLGGIVTLRSLVWTLNYPREVRGRVTSRLGMLATATVTVTSLVGSTILDASPESFRLVYAASAALALIGVMAFSRVRILDEETHLEEEREAERDRQSEAPSFSAGLLGLLRDDPLYAKYQSWQFLLGTANMMVEGPLVYLVSRELGASYTASIGITLVIPFALALLTVPFWAVYIDGVHVSEFRSRHSWIFALSQFLLFLGALQGSLELIAFSRLVLGVGRGGGMLAWQLGHNDFADRDRVALYMGVHVSLTGLRGAFAPFLGMLLYVGWSPISLGGFELGGFAGIGAQLMLVSSILSVVASAGFVQLHRKIARQ